MALGDNEIIPIFKNRSGQDGLDDSQFNQLIAEGIASTVTNTLTKITTVQLNNNQTIPNLLGGRVSWEGARDEVGAWSIANPTIITVPVDAIACEILIRLDWQSNSSGFRVLQGEVNGVALTDAISSPYYPLLDTVEASSFLGTRQGFNSLLMRCVAGDEFSVFAGHSSGGNLDLIANNTFMSVVWQLSGDGT